MKSFLRGLWHRIKYGFGSLIIFLILALAFHNQRAHLNGWIVSELEKHAFLWNFMSDWVHPEWLPLFYGATCFAIASAFYQLFNRRAHPPEEEEKQKLTIEKLDYALHKLDVVTPQLDILNNNLDVIVDALYKGKGVPELEDKEIEENDARS